MIGNSSSGLIEVPSFKIPTLNLGVRQDGRIRSKSVVDCRKISKKNIISSINKIKSKKFQAKLKNIKNPFEKKNTTKNIVKILRKIMKEKKREKLFYDLNR